MKHSRIIKYVCGIGIVVLGIFMITTTAHGLDLGIDKVNNAATQAGYSAATETTFAENVGKAIKILLSMIGVLFTILIIYAGYLWLTARGNDESISKAKGIISSSIIGLIILLMAYSITNFIVPRILQGSVNTTPTQPSGN